MKRISNLEIEVNEIRPLPTGEKFAAKVKHFYVETSEGKEKVEKSFPEFWGQTPEEAKEKAEKHLQKLAENDEI